MTTKEMRHEIIRLRLREAGIYPGYSDVAELDRIARGLRRWNEGLCGMEWGGYEYHDETGQCWQYNAATGERTPIKNRGEVLEKKLRAMCERLNCHYYIQGDPCGSVLFLGRLPITDDNYRSAVSVDL